MNWNDFKYRSHIRCWRFLAMQLMGLLMTASCVPSSVWGQERVQVYLSVEEAPKVIFPEADHWERKDIRVTQVLANQLKQMVGRAKPSIWEPNYITFIATKEDKIVGYAVICEEIGKHRPITFIVGVLPDKTVKDVAIMTYREPQGDEVRRRNFLIQFAGKELRDPIMQHQDIRNVSGATLSVRALARGVRKALAVIEAVYLQP